MRFERLLREITAFLDLSHSLKTSKVSFQSIIYYCFGYKASG